MENTGKQIFILAGPNGAGKTTFATQFIPAMPTLTQFVNADLIAYGLSPFDPDREAVQAGKLMLRQMEKLAQQGESFCLETTLSGKGYARLIREWQALGYTVTLIFLRLDTAQMAQNRVATRVRQGGHNIPADVIERRFVAGLQNFEKLYKPIVDYWFLYNNTGTTPILECKGTNV